MAGSTAGIHPINDRSCIEQNGINALELYNVIQVFNSEECISNVFEVFTIRQNLRYNSFRLKE